MNIYIIGIIFSLTVFFLVGILAGRKVKSTNDYYVSGRNAPTLLIEANTIPGFNTAQYRGYAWVTEGWGYQPLFDEGLKGTPLPQDGRYDRVLIKV